MTTATATATATTLPPISTLLGPPAPPALPQLPYQRWAYKNPPKDPSHPFTHKTVLVTGSNTGLGFEAALKFARLDAAHLILGVRTPSKGEDAKQRIIAATNYPEHRITILKLDQNSFASVREFLSNLGNLLGEERGLDVAVLNAGIAAPKYKLVHETGWEEALQVNVLSTAMVGMGVMRFLKRESPARGKGELGQLTLTGSVGHVYAKREDLIGLLDVNEGGILEVVSSREFFGVERSYCVIKVLTMYVMKGLMECARDEVWVNVVCPGFSVTELGREFPWYFVWMTRMMYWYCGRTAEQGGRSLVSATLLGEEGNGGFWVNDGGANVGEMVTSEEGMRLQERLWREIRGICERELSKM
ncbi:NAD(P)-binding protein [Aspergillus sclerotioniger CBS 115572]|uniref:NAD(P)-binding protein n=1 Tax=Aspergillus sclerotioniger CBS 115572 TaxID=1450535 RepID=A0A317X0L6_9EURO|nr:NAD(P)-binding protein [Aspergillus sclerotioniger CBS 115572]PWY91825.1 NAD(P)-binding protein [Aspergillus sclerotioniger CBS 115572]